MKDYSLPEYHQSIFHQLFEHASDQDCKLILLNQILEIGDEKEIPLLLELENSPEPRVSQKATKIKQQLLYKFDVSVSTVKKLLPMSLCFLYDEFDIRPSKFNPSAGVDFDISPDIYEME
ncbi:hypothetical protein [Flagellimonas sp. S3867]|uniref:hypothetical protein n=1 Tax=Flagellimonas sp. S3867 TaxID=2768063 RepID=UPI0016833F4D|nr:hypothetical protein [Flagellimonas sp. S3867]